MVGTTETGQRFILVSIACYTDCAFHHTAAIDAGAGLQCSQPGRAATGQPSYIVMHIALGAEAGKIELY